MPSSAREIRNVLRKEKMQRKKDAAEQAAIHSGDIEMGEDKNPHDTTFPPLGLRPTSLRNNPTKTTAQARKHARKIAADNATDLSLSGANDGDQAGEKAEPSKAQQKKARKQKREEWRVLLLRVAQKISGDDTLLEIVKNSYTSEGRTELFNAVAAIDPGAGRDSNLISELNAICDRHTLEPLRVALKYRHDVKALRDSIAERDKAELLARFEESLTVQEYENKKLELEEQRRAGQRKFVQNEAAAGREVRDPGVDARARRDRIRLHSRLMAKQKRQELAGANSAGEMNDIYAIIGGLKFDAGAVDKDTGSGTDTASEVVPVKEMSLPDP